jgi:hypothetical protein
MTSLSTIISSPENAGRREILVMVQITVNQIDENVVFIIGF